MLTAAAPAVTVTNSSCVANCTTTNGSISAPGSTCPTGSTLQYSTNGGANWTTTLPTYNQTTAITILTRCNCDVNTTISSPTTSVSTAPTGCNPPTINNLPSDIKGCSGNDVAISVNASGTGTLSYQWQVSTDGGANFTNTGTNASVLQLNGVSLGMSGNKYRVIVTDQNGCNTTSNIVTLTVTDVLPTITTDPQNTTVCGGTTATFTVGVPGSSSTRSFQWQEDSGSGFGDVFYNGFFTATLQITNVPENFNGRKYRVIVRDGCSTTSQAAMLMVTPRTPLTTLNKTVCQNSIVDLTSYQSEITNANGTFSYSIFGSPINNPNAFQVSNNGLTVNVTFTDANTGCSNSTTITFTTVQPAFLFSQTPDICSSDNPFDLTSLQSNMTNASGTFEYFFNNVKITNPTQFTAADGNVVNVTFTNSGGCQSTTTITFTVKNAATLTPQTPTICTDENPFDLTSLESAITGATGTFSYEFNNTTIPDPTQFTAADGDIVQVTFNDQASGCTSTTTITFNVNPLPTLNAQIVGICENNTLYDLTALELAITNATGTFDYTFNGNPVANPTAFNASDGDVVTVTFTDAATNCVNETTITFELSDAPIADAEDKMICSGESTALTVSNTNNFGGATFNWTAAYNGATGGAGSANNVAFGANAINETLINTTGADIEVVYTITPVVAGNMDCDGEPIEVTITVKPLPTLTAQTPTICTSDNPFNLTSLESAITSTAGTFEYTFNNATVNNPAAFIAADGNVVNVTFTNTTTGCKNTTTITFTVKPEPVGEDLQTMTCSDVALNVDLQSRITNGLSSDFTWTVSDNPNVTGEAGGSGDVITQTLNNVSSSDQIVTYTVTPTAENGCVGNTFTVEVTVKPEPVGQNLQTMTCSDVALNVDLQNQITNGLSSDFTWTVADNPNVTGEANGNGDFITQTLNNVSGSDQIVTYTVTPTAENGCVGNTFTVEVTVKPEPVGQNLQTMTCSDVALNINLQNQITNGLSSDFTWTVADNPNVSGEANGNGDFITQTLNNVSSSDQIVTYTVTPTASNGCVGNTFTVEVTVKPEPVGQNLQTMTCSDVALNINLQNQITNNLGSDFTWTVSDNPNVTGEADGNGDFITQTLNNVTGSDQIVTYTVTPTAENGCVGNTFEIEVTVKPEPVGNNLQTMTCSDVALNVDLQSQITNGLSSDFTWTVADNPNVSGEANSNGDVITQTLNNTSGSDQIVTYTVTLTAENGCVGNPFTVTVIVDGLTPGIIGSDQKVCVTKIPAALVTLTPASSSANLTYQWEMSTVSCTGGFEPVTTEVATNPTLTFTKPLKTTTYFRRRAFSTRDGLQCEAVSNCVTITVLNVDCGEFPWNGN
jgi:hypothetical protein